MDLKTLTVYTTVAAATTLTLYPFVAAQTGPTGVAGELDFTVTGGSFLGNGTNSTGEGSGCGQAWIGTIVSAGLFIVSEALPFISKSPSNGIIHTIVNGLKGTKKK